MAAREGSPGLPVQRLSDFRFHSCGLRESLAVEIVTLPSMAQADLHTSHEQSPEHVFRVFAGQLLKQRERLRILPFVRAREIFPQVELRFAGRQLAFFRCPPELLEAK